MTAVAAIRGGPRRGAGGGVGPYAGRWPAHRGPAMAGR